MASMATAWRRRACSRRSPNWSGPTAKTRWRNSWKASPSASAAASFRLKWRSSNFAPRSSPGLTARPSIPELSRLTSAPRRAGSPAFAGDDVGGWREELCPQRLQEPHRLARCWRGQLALPHYAAAAHEGADRPAGDTHAVIGRPARAGGYPFVGDGLAALEIGHCEIRVIARGDPALAGDVEQPRGTCAGEIDEPLKRQAPGVDVIEHQRHQRLHPGHARWRGWIGLGLFLKRMRGVIGAEHVDDALLDAAPDAVAMIGRSHRRIHLRAGAEPLVTFRGNQGEVMRRRFAGGDILVHAQKLDFLLGRDMQHVNAFSGFMGELDQTLRRHQRRGLVAPHGVRTRIALDAQIFAVVEPVFVLGVKRG